MLALQIGDKHRITTPVNWKRGEDVIVHPTVTAEEAKTLFPEHTVHKVREQCSAAAESVDRPRAALPEDYAPHSGLGDRHICCITMCII